MAADEIQQLHAEIEALRADLEGVRNARRSWLDRVPRPKPMRRLSAIALGLLLIALPVAVSASHQFTDVSTSNTFHTSIARVYGARLTGGCSATRYCPSANVTRGQMAAFLNRGLGRGAAGEFFDETWGDLILEDGAFVTEAQMVSNGSAGGTGHALAVAHLTLWTDEAGVCPCEVQFTLYNADTGEVSPTFYTSIGGDGVPTDDPELTGPFWQTTVSASHLFTVPSGVAQPYLAYAKVVPTNDPTEPTVGNGLNTGWTSTIQVQYLPFGAEGGNPIVPDTSGSGGPLQPRGQ